MKNAFLILSLFILSSCKGQDKTQETKDSFCDIFSTKENKEDFFIALYFVNREKKYKINLPLQYKDSWKFNNQIDSLLLNKEEEFLILNKVKNNKVILADIKKWTEIEKMLNFPSKDNFSSEVFTHTIYDLKETKFLFKKFLQSSTQDYSSLDENQKGEIYFDTINYLFNLPENKLGSFFAQYYYKIKIFNNE